MIDTSEFRHEEMTEVLHPFLVNTTVWANASKVLAIAGTALISYLGMRLWVFVSKAQKEREYPIPGPRDELPTRSEA